METMKSKNDDRQHAVREDHAEARTDFDRLMEKPALFDYNLEDEERLRSWCKTVVAGGFAPKGMSAEACFCAVTFGRELGLGKFSSIQNIAVINGRPAVWGDAALAIVQRSGLLVGGVASEELRGGKTEDEVTAVCTVRRKGSSEATRRSFSVREAKRAGLWGKAGPWSSYPRRMLQLRARAIALRDAFADVLRGIAIGEEVADIEDDTGQGFSTSSVESVPLDVDAILADHVPEARERDPGEELREEPTPFDEPIAEPEPEPKPQSRRSRAARKQVEDEERSRLAERLEELKQDNRIAKSDRDSIDFDARSRAVPLNSVRDAILFLEGLLP